MISNFKYKSPPPVVSATAIFISGVDSEESHPCMYYTHFKEEYA